MSDKPEPTLEVIRAVKVINKFMLEVGAVEAEITQIGTLRLYGGDTGQVNFASYTPVYQDMVIALFKEDKS